MLTIAANLTNELPPMILNHCFRITVYCFMLQSLVYYFYMLDYLHSQIFQPFDFIQSMMRVLATILLHNQMQLKLQKTVKLLTYLKTMKENKRGRMMNMVLVSMQILLPIFAMLAMIIVSALEKSLKQITKNFVTLGFVASFDQICVTMFQDEVIANAMAINKKGGLTISIDNNTCKKLFQRTFRSKEKLTAGRLLNFLVNLLFNCWFFLITNFQVIFYNYFISIMVVLVQIVGYFQLVEAPEYKLKV
jgi:hypothetical protein